MKGSSKKRSKKSLNVSKRQTKRTWRNLCQDKRCSCHEWNHTVRTCEWQNVSQCFSVKSWIGIQIKNKSFIHTDFQFSKHNMPECVADWLCLPSNACGVAPKSSKSGQINFEVWLSKLWIDWPTEHVFVTRVDSYL